MSFFNTLYADLAQDPQLAHALPSLAQALQQWELHERHGHFPKWQRVLNRLPEVSASQQNLHSAVEIGADTDTNDSQRQQIKGLLQQLMPWRKGPYRLFDLAIDTEWRSDWKWDRLIKHIAPLKYRRILDVGCGSGYHMWRMLGEQAAFVLGIDPSPLFLAQFSAIKHFAKPEQPIHFAPLGIEQMPAVAAFDTVFSMGVIYHRRSPIDHLYELKSQLRPGGELVLETLVVEGDQHHALVPDDRYAQMRNVWFIPSVAALEHWLVRCGFCNVRTVDVCATTTEEQRRTEWMTSDSLEAFLDPHDPNKTIEGYPAPVRAVVIANTPE